MRFASSNQIFESWKLGPLWFVTLFSFALVARAVEPTDDTFRTNWVVRPHIQGSLIESNGWKVAFQTRSNFSYRWESTSDFTNWIPLPEIVEGNGGTSQFSASRPTNACFYRVSTQANVPTNHMEWFREAKFGMFIHWGPYSRLAGEWNGLQIAAGGTNAEWIMQAFKIPAAEYRELARHFNPTQFNARAWATLARDSGMRYLAITAKHHDGFAMYQSKVSGYNIVDWTPFKRDPLKELAEACGEAGIRFCVYYSHKEDWNEPDAYGNDWDFDPQKADFEKYLAAKAKPQLQELLTGYGPLGLIWFDRGTYTAAQAQEFVQIVHGQQPGCLINGRVGNYSQELQGDYQSMSDNGMPPGGIEEYWEAPQTLNKSWGYNQFDLSWKDTPTVVRRLVEIVSKGGNYLLNVGPTGDGTIPPPSADILLGAGAWLRTNGPSIYGTTVSPFPSASWGCCTVKGQTLFLHVFHWPTNGILHLAGFTNTVRKAYFLTQPDHELTYNLGTNDLNVSLPASPLDPIDTVITLELDSPPRAQPLVVNVATNGVTSLDYIPAVTAGKAMKRYNRQGGYYISKWTTSQDTVSWLISVTKPGSYKITTVYSAQPGWRGGEYEISVGSQTLTAVVQPTLTAGDFLDGNWYKYQTFNVGNFVFDQPGQYRMVIRPQASLNHDLMYLSAIRLQNN